LLTFSLAAGVAPLLPGGFPLDSLPRILRHDRSACRSACPAAWGVVTVVTIVLCIDPESRDYLLGHGRVLSIVSTGMLLLVLTMTVVAGP